jgi:acyl-CoA synthetase (AMP-forming)/AMP-acid ligase II
MPPQYGENRGGQHRESLRRRTSKVNRGMARIDAGRFRPHQRLNADIDIPYSHVGELLMEQARRQPDKTFVLSPGIEEETLTYSELVERVVRTTAYLRQRGLGNGDRLAVVIPNSPLFVLFYFAALRMGVTFVPINPEMAPREMLYIVKNSRAKSVFCHASVADKVRQCAGELDPGVTIVDLNGYRHLDDVTESAPDTLPEIDLDHEAVIIYTSGTTGNPKGVVLCHLNLLADAKAIHDWFQFSRDTRTLCILPLFHNNGQIVTLLAPLYGGGSTVIVQGRTSLGAFWGLVDTYQITMTSVMSSILSVLLSLPTDRTDRSLRGIICGGQVLLPSVQDHFEQRFGVPIFEGFGLTETTSFSCFNDFPATSRRPGSIGRPLPINEMQIVGADGAALGPNEDGEILIRGLNVCNEYLSLPDVNAKRFVDGWFHSGDYGYRDAEGYYYFKGRRDFLIIKGGENIYPSELENVLYLHEDVDEVAVVGIPSRLLGQDLAAFVKLKETSVTTRDELKRFCIDKIAKFKQPKEIILLRDLPDMPDIPKGPTKKVLYDVLAKYYVARLSPEKA